MSINIDNNLLGKAATAGFMNELVGVQGVDPEVAQKAFTAVDNAGRRSSEKVVALKDKITEGLQEKD